MAHTNKHYDASGEFLLPQTRRRFRRTYNGHPSRAYWNVNLWIGNDEGLYNLARECIRMMPNKRKAAEAMYVALADCGIVKTPDGYAYTVAKIQHAMRGLE